MKRILFLSFLVISTLVVAVPQRFTKHLHEVSMQDCDRVLAKIVTVETKDRDLKSHLDEVPQCVTFFTERLTRESFKDKDYRRACSPLLQDFCQQHRYLSLPTLTENYKTNKLKVAGSMGLGYMFGKTTSRTVKKYLARTKDSTASKAKSAKAECFERLKSNQEIAKMCEAKPPQDCIKDWKLKDKDCINEDKVCDETKSPKLVCECIPDNLEGPPDWSIIYSDPPTNSIFERCEDKREKDCDKLNGVNTKPYRVAGKPNTGYFAGKKEKRNSKLHIIKWKYDSADTSRGIEGCYVNLCEEGYKVDSWELGCIEIPEEEEEDTPPPPPPPAPSGCSEYGADNGKGEDILANYGGGHVFGGSTGTSTCRTVCNENYASKHYTATRPGSGKCKLVDTTLCDSTKHPMAGKSGDNVIGWEYKGSGKCSALCEPGTEYNNINPTKDIDLICEEKEKEEEEADLKEGLKEQFCAQGFKRFVKFKSSKSFYFDDNSKKTCKIFNADRNIETKDEEIRKKYYKKATWDNKVIEVFCGNRKNGDYGQNRVSEKDYLPSYTDSELEYDLNPPHYKKRVGTLFLGISKKFLYEATRAAPNSDFDVLYKVWSEDMNDFPIGKWIDLNCE